MILANLAAFKSIAEIKHLFPGADFLDVHLDRSLLAGAGGKPRGGSYETSRAKSSLRPALRPALHANLHVNHIAAVFGHCRQRNGNALATTSPPCHRADPSRIPFACRLVSCRR